MNTLGRLGSVAARIVPHAQKLERTAAAIEGTIGLVRLGQGAYEFAQSDGSAIQSAGYLGEAFLRLYSVKVAFRAKPDLEVVEDVTTSGRSITSLLRSNSKRVIIQDTATDAFKRDLAELRVDLVMRRTGYEKLPSKLPHDNGIDSLWVLRGADGKIKKVMIIESKFSTRGRFELGTTVGHGKQMSNPWIEWSFERMSQSTDSGLRSAGEELLRLWKTNKELFIKKGAILTPDHVLRFTKPTAKVN